MIILSHERRARVQGGPFAVEAICGTTRGAPIVVWARIGTPAYNGVILLKPPTRASSRDCRGVVRRILVYGGARRLTTAEGIEAWPIADLSAELAAGRLWP